VNTIKTFSKILLCISISTYGLPLFAYTVPESSKVELSDAAMASAVGGSMHAEILKAPSFGTDGEVQALVSVSNGNGCCNLVYALEAIDTSGNVVRTLASGSISGNQALVISGKGLADDIIYRARVDFSNANLPGLEAVDTVWPQFQ
jgi:hypothetical protein